MAKRIRAPNDSTATHVLVDGTGNPVGWYSSHEDARIAARANRDWICFSAIELIHGGAEIEAVSAYSCFLVHRVVMDGVSRLA